MTRIAIAVDAHSAFVASAAALALLELASALYGAFYLGSLAHGVATSPDAGKA